MGGSLEALDWAAIAFYAGTVLWIGLRAARGAADPHLAGRDMPGWAVLLSLTATELSAATFIGVPHASYRGDWSYLQLAFGALLGKAVLAWHVVPLYHRLRVVTVYGYLEERYGPRSRRVAALCFVAGRTLASGVRLFIAALAFSAVTGWSVEATIVVCGVVAGGYTLAGGIRAVIWTDTFQAGIFVLSALAIATALTASAGGISELLGWATGAERTRVIHLEPLLSLASSKPLLVGILGGFFLTLATHSTDHDMVQRLLTTRDGHSGSRALAWSALINFPMTLLFLFIGTGLALFYTSEPGYDISDGNRIVAIFALHELPAGLRGLLFSGLFAAAMSSLDSAICAISTTWVVDISPRAQSAAQALRRTRWTSGVFCLALMGAAVGMSLYERALSGAAGPGLSLVELALSAMTILYGGLLGVFGLGFVSRTRGNDASAIAGLAAGGLTGLLLFLHPLLLGETWIAWTWWVPIGATVSLAVAASSSRTPG